MSTDELGPVLVVIPTYDEVDNLRGIVARLRVAVPAAHVLVVDDNSPDGTGALADDLAAGDDHVHVLHRSAKRGLGAAYVAGFRWAMQREYDVVVEMDADGSHAPEQLPDLLAELEHADLVLGSRWMPGGQVHDWSAARVLLSKGGNLYARLLLRMPLRDATGGFRAFRMEVLQALPLQEVSSAGYCFQVDLAWRAWQAGYRVREVPITFRERQHGQSKMSRAIVAEALVNVTLWAVTNRGARLRARVGQRGVH